MPGEVRVQPARLLDQCEKTLRSGREPNPRADRADVVEMTPEALELEQDRSGSCELRGRLETQCLLACVGVTHRVRHPARAAGPGHCGEPIGQRQALDGPLEPSMLVAESGVEQKDPLPDDVEAEVARLDDARVDRPHGNLVSIVAGDRHGPARKGGVVVEERAQRLVP